MRNKQGPDKDVGVVAAVTLFCKALHGCATGAMLSPEQTSSHERLAPKNAGHADELWPSTARFVVAEKQHQRLAQGGRLCLDTRLYLLTLRVCPVSN